MDRLYRALDGKPRYIIRNLTDGTQVKLDPQTREVIERFGSESEDRATGPLR